MNATLNQRCPHFVGRDREKEVFNTVLNSLKDGSSSEKRQVIALHAWGGYGKTCLLKEFTAICQAEVVPFVYINFEEQKISSLFRFLTAIAHSFVSENMAGLVDHRLFDAFLQRLMSYRPSNFMINGQPFSGDFVELIDKQFSPAEDKAVPEQSYKVDTTYPRSLLNRITGRKRTTISESDLVRECLTALNNSHGNKPLVMMLDAYEWAIKRNLDEYIQTHILSAVNLPALIVISGRQEMLLSGKLLPQVCPNPFDIRLGPLSRDDARTYIQQVHPLKSKNLLDLAIETAEGVPLGLRLVVNAISNYRNEVDAYRMLSAMGVIGVRANIVEILTTKWLRELPPAIQNSTKAASILREFDLESLTYLLERTKTPVVGLPDLSMRITGRSGRGWAIHEEMRQVIRDFVRLSDWESFVLWNKRAAEFFYQRIQGLLDKPSRFQDDQWKRDSTEWIYHSIQSNEIDGFQILFNEMNDALWEVEYDDCLSYLDAIAELGYFEHEPWLNPLREAIEYSTRDEHSKAIKAFQSLLQAEPPISRSVLQHLAIDNIGYRYLKLQDWAQASETIKASLDFYQVHNDFFKLATAQEQIADCLEKQMNFKEAQAWREKALGNFVSAKSQPHRLLDATFQEAITLAQLGRKEEGIEKLKSFINSEKPSIGLSIRWARFLATIGNWSEAIEAWKQVGELSDDHFAWAWEIIGDIFVNQLKDLNQGIQAYDKSFQSDQTRWTALRHAAEAYEDVEQWTDAAEMHTRAGNLLDEIKIPALAHAARCLASSGKVEEAETSFSKLLEENPTEIDLLKQWYQFLNQQHRWREAVEVLNKIAELSQVEKAEALEAAGNILYQELDDSELALSSFQSSYEADPSRWSPLNQAAKTYEDKEEWENASKTYRRIAENFSSIQAPALANAARCLGKSGEIKEAESILKDLVQKNPSEIPVLHQSALFLEDNQRWEEAATVFQTIAGISEQDSSWAWENVGDIYFHHLDAVDQAIAAYENSYQADNNRWTALRQASLAYEGAGRWMEAAEAHDRAAKAAPHIRYAAWAYAARCVAQAGEIQEARSRFEKLAEEAPQDMEVLNQWVQFLEEQREWEEAITVHLKIAEAHEDNRAEAWEHIGVIYSEKLYDLEKAIEAFETSYQHDNQWWSSLRQAALACEFYNQWERAAQSHFHIAEINPEHRLISKASGARCTARAGDIKKAETIFSELLQEDSENSVVHWEFAQYLEDQKRFINAINTLKKLADLSTDFSPACWEKIGDIYAFHLKDLDTAIQAYQQSIQIEPNRWTAIRQMAAAYESFEEWLLASQAHQRAVELIPTFKSFGIAHAARCLERAGDAAQAEEQFQELLRMNSSSIPIKEQWAAFLEHQERWDEAVEVYQAVIPYSDDQEGRLMQVVRGCEILHRQEEVQKAYTDLEDRLTKQPFNITACRRLAWVFLKTGRLDEAREKISSYFDKSQFLDRIRSQIMLAVIANIKGGITEYNELFNQISAEAPIHSDIIWEIIHDIHYLPEEIWDRTTFAQKIEGLSRRSLLNRN